MNEIDQEFKEKYITTPEYKFDIFRPGGNDTCLFSGIIRDQHERKVLNDMIMKNYPNIEQVGFINPDPSNPELLMAGGEFCANATRSTAWKLLNGQTGEISIKVSGVEAKLRAGITKKAEAYSQMPIYPNPEKIIEITDGSYIVAMEGITHFVTPAPEDIKLLTEDDLKKRARLTMKQLDIDRYPAAGVIYVSNERTTIAVTPIVYVRNINTLFYETACGSGTTAVGLIQAKETGSSIDLPVMQPSGMMIRIKVAYDGKKFNYAEISGPVEQLAAGLIEKESDTTIEEVISKEQMIRYLTKENLIQLYKDVFGGPPYFEEFTEQEVIDEFMNYLTNGYVSVARNNGKIVAFEGTCRASKSSIAPVMKTYGFDPEKYWYFGDLGVDAAFRRQGIGKKLTEQRLKKLTDPIILRTNRNNYQAINLYQSLKFKVLDGWRQNVVKTRIEGAIEEDERVFLVKEQL